MASCRVRPYRLIYWKLGNDDSKANDDNQFMLEDGLQDIKDLNEGDQEIDSKDDKTDDNLDDEKKDAIGAKYMKVINSVSFFCFFHLYC